MPVPDAPQTQDDDPAAPEGALEENDPSVRRCLVTGERMPKETMIRFVLGPDGSVVPDLAAKLPGRGMWLSADAQSIKTALDRRMFARAAKSAATAPADLGDRVTGLLVRRCIDAISLARRAGEAVCGFEKTKAALGKPGVAVLIQARDGAADGRGKLAGKAGRGNAGPGNVGHGEAGRSVPVVSLLDAAEIGEAFGREATVHAALLSGGLSRRFLMEARRLSGFRN